VEVPPNADLLHVNFTGPEGLGRAAHCVVFRLIETRHKVSIESNFGSEEFGVEHGLFVPRIAV
jgi:hypothetical protein